MLFEIAKSTRRALLASDGIKSNIRNLQSSKSKRVEIQKPVARGDTDVHSRI